MNLRAFLEYGLPTIMVAVLLLGTIIVFCRQRLKQKAKENVRVDKSHIQIGSTIVDSVRTNNSVHCLENTFKDLMKNLDDRQLKLNIDLRGYTTDAE